MKVSDRIATMVHAFDDDGRKQEVRDLVERVKRMETALRKIADHAGPGTVWAGICEAALNDKDANCIHCGYPENCHQDNPLFHDHVYEATK